MPMIAVFIFPMMDANLCAQDSLHVDTQRDAYADVFLNPTVGFGIDYGYWWVTYFSTDIIFESVYDARYLPQFAFGCSVYPLRIIKFQVFYGFPVSHPDASFTPNYSIGYDVGILMPLGKNDSPFILSLCVGRVTLVDSDYEPNSFSLDPMQSSLKKKFSKSEYLFRIGLGIQI